MSSAYPNVATLGFYLLTAATDQIAPNIVFTLQTGANSIGLLVELFHRYRKFKIDVKLFFNF